MSYALITDAALTTAYTLAQAKKLGYSLGEIRLGLTGQVYQFAYIDDDVDITAAKSVLRLADNVVSDHACTPDYTGGSAVTLALTNASQTPVSGIAMATADVSAGYRYMWIQTSGLHAGGFTTDTYIIIGSGLIAHPSSDGAAGIAIQESDGDPTVNTHTIFGWAIEADDATPVAGAVLLTNCCGV